MSNDTLTIALNGDVSLDDFSITIDRFSSLVRTLSREVGGELPIDWVIEDLQAGSATATIRGIAERIDVVEKVVRAYMVVGAAIEQQEPIPYSDEVGRQAMALTRVLDGRITSIRFETAFADVTLASSTQEGTRRAGPIYSLGIVIGHVETVTRRRGLKFVLYDQLFDRAVSCYLREGQEEDIRSAWGKKVAVSGRIGRDHDSGKPTVVRDIQRIDVLETPAGDYSQAGLILSGHDSPMLPEQVIRRLRDD